MASVIERLREANKDGTVGPCRVHAGYLPNTDYPHLVTCGDRNDATVARFVMQREAEIFADVRNALPALLALADAVKNSGPIWVDESNAAAFAKISKALADLEKEAP